MEELKVNERPMSVGPESLCFEEFVIALRSDRAGCRIQVLQSPIGSRPELALEWAYEEESIDQLLLRFQQEGTCPSSKTEQQDLGHQNSNSTPQTKTARTIGQALYRILFSGDVGECFHRSLTAITAHPGKGMRIRLVFEVKQEGPDRMAALPWELLCYPCTSIFLACDIKTPVIRELQGPAMGGVPVCRGSLESPVRVLVAIAGPSDRTTLDLPAEFSGIETALGKQAQIECLCRVGFEALHAQLRRGRHHILHFMGHGLFDPDDGGALVFQNAEGKSELISGKKLAVNLRGLDDLQLILLNACTTGSMQQLKDIESSLSIAAELALSGQKIVIAMQVPISDPDAIRFSQAIYEALADGEPIETAVTRGRLAIFNRNARSFEWASPVLLWHPAWPASSPPPPAPLLAVLAAFIAFVAGLVSLTPYSPPLFPQAPWLAGISGLVLFFTVLLRETTRDTRDQGWAFGPRRTRLGIGLLGGAVLLAAAYMLLLRFTTVSPPSGWDAATRIQIGFHTATFSLTPEALIFLGRYPEMRTPEQLMLAFAIYESGETELVWRLWTIIAAGLALTGSLIGSFLCWGWGCGEGVRLWYGPVADLRLPIQRVFDSFANN